MSEVTDGKAKIRVYVKLDSEGNSCALTNDEREDGNDHNDGNIGSSFREFAIDVTASVPAALPDEDSEPAGTVDVPDEPSAGTSPVEVKAVAAE